MQIKIRKILCPVDFSENSEHSIRYAVTLAETFDAELLLVHVVDSNKTVTVPGDMIQQIDENYAERLENLAEEARETYNEVSIRLVFGTPFLEIIRLARAENANMIVMATHGRTGLAHMLIGSVAEKVVRMAPCPVLTVKHPEYEFQMP